MDRINSDNIGYDSQGRRIFKDDPPATTINDQWCNGIQEELMSVIESEGFAGNVSDDTLLLKAITAAIARATTAVKTPAGAMTMFAGVVAPAGFLLCDGSAISRSTYAELFTAIGTSWGAGDGSTTFNIPDMRGASPGGAGTSIGYTENETIVFASKHDDQVMDHSHGLGKQASLLASGTDRADVGRRNTYVPGANWTFEVQKLDGTAESRKGATTHGKIVGTNFIIKY